MTTDHRDPNADQDRIAEAKHNGAMAHHMNATKAHNPEPAGTMAAKAWDAGWDRAERAYRRNQKT